MKKLSEEDITRLIDEQLYEDNVQGSPADNQDAALYLELFTALADEPNTVQHLDLANAVIAQIKVKEQKAEAVKYITAIAAVIVGGVLFLYFSINYISPGFLSTVFNLILPYKWILLFVIFCFLLIEVTDRSFVKRKLIAGH